ncbi:MAG: DNA mismatch repair protein MutS [Stygiobacter sp.]|nr:MAG: DNA mismatch repair protein MutS [Stygiobacter sp. RIFOXYB2_FULL_37_11]OGV14332.1 MAG: DNA mismatch repair protein MutS [Stygiobacter sp. RIFOXYA2_FULL_38_8]OGV15982.1 MAG: DNA mismatch repair protein MutS [Stygiobacter sp. RIFOXYC2_FULL_38_25]OGV80459.1 MAG: DNA mismatch repair protein MutS [Stygiobacter sp. GWF2_38_21]RJQ65018.1 MAG: DNA mismatch repair protein MutS [Stygiobacter sp.]
MSATPLMAQYAKVKESYPDTVLLFRVGDFFETFDEDAKTASKVLGITLTRRANGAAGDVPLAGFPHHAIDTYLPKLVRAGYRVAVCEQMENPKFAKGIVKREVVEVVTPGVAISDKLLDHKKNNYVLSIFIENEIAGLAFADISTGEFQTFEVKQSEIAQQFGAINPSEILIPKKLKQILEPIINKAVPSARITKIDDWIFDFGYGSELLMNHFNTKTLKGFGIENFYTGICAAGAALNYLRETQKANLTHINKIARFNPSDYMLLDYSTKRNLEITFTMQDGEREGSLISILDKTATSMGGRMLKKWITSPLRKLEPILKRQECIEEFVSNKTLRKNLQNEFSEIGDLERLISKVCTGRVNPREIVSLKSSLKKIPLIKQLLDQSSVETITAINHKLNSLESLIEKIESAVADDPPLAISDGGVIRKGFNVELDELRSLSTNAKDWIANLQKTERERTKISSLKVSYNKVFGYYIEISNANREKAPENYIRKQTLVNGERFITPELKEYEDKILNAQENIQNLEYKLFDEIRIAVAQETEAIQENAQLIAMLDCYQSLAECAVEYNYHKPELNNSDVLEIIDGRHPVVERILPPGEKFTPNSCKLSSSEEQIIILTGPNMAGKSVYLRQIGLLVLMAQIGSFVPAKQATIGLVDRIYTRVGASDNIAAGESTFLVEMQEAANILNNATSKSLILLDEIGRGTSTFDGISIAWAITEYLHENVSLNAKTLFATHYHELNEMADIFPRIRNFKVEVREYGDKVIFLHKVTPGGADHSYGIQVAQMAGLPQFVTNRAKEILVNLEGKELTPYEIKKAKLSKFKQDEMQISLFEMKDDSLRKEISDIAIDSLTPLEALNKLSELKKQIDDNKE